MTLCHSPTHQVSLFPGEAPTISESLSASAMRAGAVIQPQASDFLVRLRIAEKGVTFPKRH